MRNTGSKHSEIFRQIKDGVADIRLQFADNRAARVGAFDTQSARRAGNGFRVDINLIFGTAFKIVASYRRTVFGKGLHIVGFVDNGHRSTGRANGAGSHAGRQSIDIRLIFGLNRQISGRHPSAVADICLRNIVRINMHYRTADRSRRRNNTAHALTVNHGIRQRIQRQITGGRQNRITGNICFCSVADIRNTDRGANTHAGSRNFTGQVVGINLVGSTDIHVAAGSYCRSRTDIGRGTDVIFGGSGKFFINVTVVVRQINIVRQTLDIQAFLIFAVAGNFLIDRFQNTGRLFLHVIGIVAANANNGNGARKSPAATGTGNTFNTDVALGIGRNINITTG